MSKRVDTLNLEHLINTFESSQVTDDRKLLEANGIEVEMLPNLEDSVPMYIIEKEETPEELLERLGYSKDEPVLDYRLGTKLTV